MSDAAATLNDIAAQARALATMADIAARDVAASGAVAIGGNVDFFVTGLTVFALACFVGYYVVWRVTPALHSPLMAVTNAISSVIIVGALIAAGPLENSTAKILGFVAVVLAGINIFGGFVVTQRMLGMYRRKESK